MELDDFDENDLFIDDFVEEQDEVEGTESEADPDKMTDEEKKKLLEAVWEQSEKEIKKKAARPRKPRPKLTEQELLSEKGIPALKAMFDCYKFSEEMDPYEKLHVLLGKMEFWAHNLFPSMTFNDCLDKFEQIGRRRMVKNSIRRLRLGMPLDDENVDKNEDENGEKKEGDNEQIEDVNEANVSLEGEASQSVKRDEGDNDAEEADELDNFFERMRKGRENDVKENVENGLSLGHSQQNEHENEGVVQKFAAKKRRKIVIDDDDF